MSIDPLNPRLTAYVLGELNRSERADVERQLQSSKELRAVVDEIRQAVKLLSAQLETETAPGLSHLQREVIFAHAEDRCHANGHTAPRMSRSTKPAVPSSRRHWSAPLAAAAALLIVCGLGYLAGSRGFRPAYQAAPSTGEISTDTSGGGTGSTIPPPIPIIAQPGARSVDATLVNDPTTDQQGAGQEPNDPSPGAAADACVPPVQTNEAVLASTERNGSPETVATTGVKPPDKTPSVLDGTVDRQTDARGSNPGGE